MSPYTLSKLCVWFVYGGVFAAGLGLLHTTRFVLRRALAGVSLSSRPISKVLVLLSTDSTSSFRQRAFTSSPTFDMGQPVCFRQGERADLSVCLFRFQLLGTVRPLPLSDRASAATFRILAWAGHLAPAFSAVAAFELSDVTWVFVRPTLDSAPHRTTPSSSSTTAGFVTSEARGSYKCICFPRLYHALVSSVNLFYTTRGHLHALLIDASSSEISNQSLDGVNQVSGAHVM